MGWITYSLPGRPSPVMLCCDLSIVQDPDMSQICDEFDYTASESRVYRVLIGVKMNKGMIPDSHR